MLHLDHAIIAVADLDAAIRDYRDLGFTVIPGGIHANRSTHNALVIFLDGTYLELLAATGEKPLPKLIDFSLLLQHGEGLVGYALRSDDLEAEVLRLKASGFTVGEIIPGERRRDDGTIIRWQLALIHNSFAPFLIQDVTPRECRVPNNTAVTPHANRALGIRHIEIAVQSIEESWDHYINLLGFLPNQVRRYTYPIGSIYLRGTFSKESLSTPIDELYEYPKMFGGSVPQSEIDAANPDLEPESFTYELEMNAKSLAQLQDNIERYKAMNMAIKDKQEAPFAIHLVREQGADDRFKLEHTHNVHFLQITGAPPTRGEHILIGLDDIDWGAMKHMFGVASDIPPHLRALASDDRTVRQDAYQSLANHILHQGSVTEASIETIPFFTQLILAPEVEDKNLLRHLVNSVTSACMRHPDLRQRTQTVLDDLLPTYLEHFTHPDVEVRGMIAIQLQHFTSQIDLIESLLKTHIASDESAIIKAECVTSLEKLWTAFPYAEPERKLTDEQSAYFAGLMRDTSQPAVVHFRTARMLARDNQDKWWQEALAVFYVVMQKDESELEAFDIDGFWLGNIFYRVTDILLQHPKELLDWIITQAKHPGVKVRDRVPYALENLLHAQKSNDLVPQMLLAVIGLMRDSSSQVRQSAVGFFFDKSFGRDVISLLQNMRINDPSLTVRVVARNTLSSIASDATNLP